MSHKLSLFLFNFFLGQLFDIETFSIGALMSNGVTRLFFVHVIPLFLPRKKKT